MVKKSIKIALIACISIASIYMVATTSTPKESKESTYEQFAASYESLFNEKPAEVWVKKSPECANDCNHCDHTA